MSGIYRPGYCFASGCPTFVAGDLRLGVIGPGLHMGVLDELLVIARGERLRQLGAVVAEAQGDRRVHGIGNRVVAEQPWAARRILRPAFLPELLIRAMSSLPAGGSSTWALPVAFMGQCVRRAAKPECISALTARAWARTAESAGQARPCTFSLRYSAMASESQIVSRRR